MSKQIDIPTRPKPNKEADAWVDKRTTPNKPRRTRSKRLTLDLAPELHTRLRIHCATNDIWISDLLRRLIEDELSNPR